MKKPTAKAVTVNLPIPTARVTAGQRWLITAERAPWSQSEDLTLTVGEVYTLSEHELKSFDITTAAAMRGVEYAVLSGEEVAGIQLPTELLAEIGKLVQ